MALYSHLLICIVLQELFLKNVIYFVLTWGGGGSCDEFHERPTLKPMLTHQLSQNWAYGDVQLFEQQYTLDTLATSTQGRHLKKSCCTIQKYFTQALTQVVEKYTLVH